MSNPSKYAPDGTGDDMYLSSVIRLDNSTAFDYFDRVFCINRESRHERWQVAENELRKLCLSHRVERYSAIEDRDPERGCMRSHMACVEEAAASHARNVLIFEDDIKVYNTREVERAIWDLQRLPWRLFYLGGYPSYRSVKIRTGAKYYNSHLCRLFGGYLCGHAYAVNSNVFASYSRATQPIDRWLAYDAQPNMLSMVTNKMVVGQQDGYSDLRGKERGRGFIKRRHDRMIRNAQRAYEKAP